MAEVLSADVAVVGGGPAGIAAATAAAAAGRRVLLFDEGPRPGGQIWRHRAGAAPARARKWLDRLARSGAVRVPEAAVFAISERFSLLAETPRGSVPVAAGAVVLATGARERFLPFPGWTLPNVFGIGGAQALLKGGADFRDRTVVIAGSGPLLLPVAALLARAGARVAVVAEQAPSAAVFRFAAGLWRAPRTVADALSYRRAFARTPYRFGVWVTEARGDDRVREAVLTDGSRSWTIPCDLLCTGFGLVPSTELARLAGCRIAGETVEVDEGQRTSVPGVFAAGEPTGVGGVEKALVEGEIAGCTAAGRKARRTLLASAKRRRHYAEAIGQAFAPRPELRALPRPETIVCRCEDVPAAAFDPRWSARQAKLYTRAGMGPCQGRVCGPALRYLFGWESDSVRLPISPVSLETLAADRQEDR
ncbi:MAG TPA: FAD/NAD(P)-binding oxidoreductase [Thermoanaerobaculia bacterium]|nr:FAD/NAD(P)-binding oxidoreductase [Thermoanaerobaculia bacterium]